MPVTETSFSFPGQISFYKGKVRDVYNIQDEWLLMVATDRISAFDVVLPAGIPHKGQVLNQIASMFLDSTASIVPNWKVATPDPMVTIGHRCEPFRVEMVVRGYLTGHAWRVYKQGIRELCGVKLPDGMKENEAFPEPIITPTTKADQGHDMDISRDEIIGNNIVSEQDYVILENYSRLLFRKGTEMASERGLILVDTKYEFGKKDGNKIMLIDEIHTPDSSRYFYLDTYDDLLKKNLPQKQLSKEFVRQWLLENNFSGQPGQNIPLFSPNIINSISDRYIELFETLTGRNFQKYPSEFLMERIENNCNIFLKSM